MKKGLKKRFYKMLSFPKVVIGNLQKLFAVAVKKQTAKNIGRSPSPADGNFGDGKPLLIAIRLPRLRLAMTALRGFTLIELLVVVLIIGILAAVALPQYEKAVMKSRYATLMDMVNAIGQAEEVYYLANGSYTDDFEALDVSLSGCTLSNDKKTCTYPWGKCLLDASGNDRISCENTQSLNNAYVHYFKNSADASDWGKACWALTTNRSDKYNKLCESMGASYFMQAGCTSGGCTIYRF